MVRDSPERRLAAILVADVAGYSRLMEADEAGTLAVLNERRKGILEPVVKTYGGRVVKLLGDGALVEFASAVKAVEAALELQVQFAAANEGADEDHAILLRIGINMGDVIGEGRDIFGDGVNIAARLETLAKPGGICISAKVHEEIRNKINARFESMGEQRLKNLSVPVSAFGWSMARAVPFSDATETREENSRIAIAVLPFDNLSGDPAQQYVSDGITEDITTELARFSGLSVVARHLAFHYAGAGKNLAEIARALNVNFIVEGSARFAGGRVRITAQLIDVRTGNHLWADRYDRDSKDVFAIQDQVISSIVSMLEVRMVAAEAANASRKPTSSWSAYDSLLQGRELCNHGREPDAISHFARTIAIDPDFVLGHAWLSLAQSVAYAHENCADDALLRGAEVAAQRALALDLNDPTAHHAAAMAAMYGLRHTDAGRHFKRAISLNPADIQIQADHAQWLRYTGRLDEALAAIDDALGHGPHVPTWFWSVRGEILFDQKRYAEALAAFESVLTRKTRVWFFLAATQAHLGEVSKVAETLRVLLRQWPAARLDSLPFVNPTAYEDSAIRLREGLRMAGIPE